MGNEQSQLAVLRAKVSEILPAYKPAAKDPRSQKFMNGKDREQFITALLVVLSNNSIRDLKDHNFALLYSRRANAQDRIVARVVASKEGVIRAKAEAAGHGEEGSGQDHDEAFRVFKRYVEARLDDILMSLPSDGPNVQALARVLGGKSEEALHEQESVAASSVAGGSQETLMPEPIQVHVVASGSQREEARSNDAPPAYDG